MVEILTASGFSLGGGLRDLALSRMQDAMLAQIEKETAVNTDKYQAKYEEYQAAAQTSRVVSARLSLVANTIQQNLDHITTIKDNLFDMKVAVETAATTTDMDYIRQVFDSAMTEVNRAADALPKVSNLIGNVGKTTWNTPEISYQTDDIGTRIDITGEYLGSDFYIEDSSGNVWVPDWSIRAMERFTGIGEYSSDTKVDSAYYTFDGNGINLNSLSGSAIDFTVFPDVASETATYTGTLYKGGLEVMPSWMYSDFATEADRTTATDDVDTARDVVNRQEAILKSELAKIQGYENAAKQTVEQYNELTYKAYEEGYIAQYEGQVEMQNRYQAMIINLQATAASQGNYTSLFRGAIRGMGKLTGSLLNQLV